MSRRSMHAQQAGPGTPYNGGRPMDSEELRYACGEDCMAEVGSIRHALQHSYSLPTRARTGAATKCHVPQQTANLPYAKGGAGKSVRNG